MAIRTLTLAASGALRLAAACALALAAIAAVAAPPAALPYDGSADAHAEIRQALATARATNRPVLLIFGANWCEDCRALDAALHSPANAPLIAQDFEVVKIDVGRFDRNLDIATSYGEAIAHGIPSAVIVSPANAILYATRAGELADARTMSQSGIHDFFVTASEVARQGH
jgi:thioredoxin 1